MTLRELKELINSIPKEKDGCKVYIKAHDLEKGYHVKEVSKIKEVELEKKEMTFGDAFNGTMYRSTIKKEAYATKDVDEIGILISNY